MGLTKVFAEGVEGLPIEVHGFDVGYTETIEIDPEYRNTQERTKHVEVSRTNDGKRAHQEPFSKIDADLIALQVTELETLRDNGDLPNISPDLSGITDPWKQSD